MATDKNGKLTYQMTSPGDAWNNFVNSKEGHNAAAVTPSYLEGGQNPRPSIEARLDNKRKEMDGGKEPDKNVEMDKPKEKDKDIERDR